MLLTKDAWVACLIGSEKQLRSHRLCPERRISNFFVLHPRPLCSSARMLRLALFLVSVMPDRYSRREGHLEDGVLTVVPPDPLVLDIELLMKTLRSAKKGSAGGPSGIIVEHLRPLLESGFCTALLGEVATQFARGQVPEEVLSAVRLGKMTAVQKPDGGVRGIVVGDVFRRLALAKQFAKQAQGSNTSFPARSLHPCKHGMCCTRCAGAHQTRSKCNNLVHRWRWGLRFNFEKGDVSWPMDMVDGEKLVPFVRLFHDSPSTYMWEDDVGDVRHVCQGEGGEQEDPLMPLLFSLGQNWAMVAVQASLLEVERLFCLFGRHLSEFRVSSTCKLHGSC